MRVKGKVLAIDDHEGFREILTQTLTFNHYEVLACEDGVTGIEVARQEQPDVILLDLIMSGQDGFETCRLLRNDPLTAHIPIIVLSALSGPKPRAKAFEAGADDYIEKPCSAVELDMRISEILRRKQLGLSLRRHVSVSL